MTDPQTSESARDIVATCDKLCLMLLSKNKSYGDSALNPLRVFSRASPEESLLVRIDDKLSRIARGHEYGNDDNLLDLIGYLILLKISRERQRRAMTNELEGSMREQQEFDRKFVVVDVESEKAA